jgi:hypothetical protein
MPINRDLCKLMTEDLVRRFDHLEAQFARVRGRLPHLWEKKDLQELGRRLERLRGQMERPRYYVGFLGRSQVGKSSTLNSVLRPAPGEEPCTGGKGAPATSTVTRIFRPPPGAGNGKHLCSLRFMTPEEFRRRREILCGLLGFNPKEVDASLIAQLEELIRRDEAPQEDEGTHATKSDKIEDYKYFARLLRSAAKFGAEVIRDPALVQEGDFARRDQYTNHPEGQDVWQSLLLNQVEIAYQTEGISEKIELVDLPGLGARLASDDELTRAFLPNLDGALIFQSSEQVAAKEAYDLLSRLSNQYPRMQGRVWMVITRFDAVARNSYGYGSATTIFDNIHKTMTDNKVPLTQVLLVGNEFHRQLRNPDGTVHPPTAENFRLSLNLDVDAQNQPIIPEGFGRHPDLLRAFGHVLEDGGIARVREIIGATLAEEVEREVREQVDSELKALTRALARQVRAAKDTARMDTQAFRRTVQWKVRLQQVLQEIDRDSQMVESPALELIASLKEEFAALCPETLLIDRRRLRRDHQDYVRVLRDQAVGLSREMLASIYGVVGQRLKGVEEKVGKVRLGGSDSPLSAWEDRQERDLADLSWYVAEIQSFERPELFPPGEEEVQLRDVQYRQVMARKIDSVVQRAAFTVGRRIKGHLGELIENLTLIDGSNGHVDTGDPRLFDEILDALA